jgi:hypothetical protein
MEHFATPAASDGKVFLATGQTIEAYTVANPVQPPPNPPPPSTPSTTPSNPSVPSCGCTSGRCRMRLALRIPRHARVIRASVFLGRKRIAFKRGHRLVRISFRPPAYRTSFSIRVVEITSRHHRLSYPVRYRNCRRVKTRRQA